MIEMPPIKGALVELAPFGPDCIDDDYLSWLNDPQVVRFSNQRFRKHDLDTCRDYLDSFASSPNLFVSIRTRGGDRIGTMTAYRSPHHGTADVGIMVGDKRSWGEGFGQDAWNTMLAWLLSDGEMRKVTAGTLTCNVGMVRLMERSGMSLEGVRRAQELVDGLPEDMVLYGKFAQ